MQPVLGIITTMLLHMSDENNDNRLDFKEKDEVAVIVNNLGATSVLEELIVCNKLVSYLGQ
jgi:dihydroxyacetone kinase